MLGFPGQDHELSVSPSSLDFFMGNLWVIFSGSISARRCNSETAEGHVVSWREQGCCSLNPPTRNTWAQASSQFQMHGKKTSELKTWEGGHSEVIVVGPSFWKNMKCEIPQDRPLHAEQLPQNDWSWRVPTFLSMPDANKNNNSKETVFPFFVSKKILRNHVGLLKLLVSRAAGSQANTPQPIYFLLLCILNSNWHIGQSIKPMGMHQWGHYKRGCYQQTQQVKECLISHKASKNLFPIPPSSASSLASSSSPPTSQLQSPAH